MMFAIGFMAGAVVVMVAAVGLAVLWLRHDLAWLDDAD